MIGQGDIDRVTSATAYDDSGEKIGKVGQVYLDDSSGEPTWVTVKTGLFGTSESFIPLQGARFDGDDLHVGYSKDRLKDAPRVDADGHITPEEERRLYEYYGLGWDDHATTTTTTGTVGTEGTSTYGTGGKDVGTDEEIAVTRSEERLDVGTRTEEAGRARLRKYTTTETETVDVPVTKEKLVVERNPVEGTRTTEPIGEVDETEEITLREERPVVAKETVAVEEVRVGKEQVTDTERVTEQVREEHVEVDTEGDTGTTR